jgi:hypothetical protein
VSRKSRFRRYAPRALARDDEEFAAPVIIEEDSSSPWIPVAIGLGVIALVGIAGVIVYLLVRRGDNSSGGGQLGDARYLPSSPQVYLIHTGNGQPQVVRAEPVAASPSNDNHALDRVESKLGALLDHFTQPQRHTPSSMRTYRLPWLADQDAGAIRIATAGAEPYEVTVRVVSPPGALAALSFSTNELDLPQQVIAPNMSAVPAGDTLVIPAGQKHVVRMNPRQALYAKGNFGPGNMNGPVIVSITASDYYGTR